MMQSASPDPSARRRALPRKLRKAGRGFARSPLLAGPLAWLAIRYLRFTFRTNAWTVEPADARRRAESLLPVIAAVWHGQHLLLPAIPFGIRASVMISRSLDGEITARIAEAFGSRPIRASGGRESKKLLQKGGMTGFLEMLSALERGESVLQTADIPKGSPRRAGEGIISLARRSGRPIVPIALATSRRHVFGGAWDRTTLNLPFGKAALCVGEPIYVAAGAGQAEAARLALENELNRITVRAYELTGKPE